MDKQASKIVFLTHSSWLQAANGERAGIYKRVLADYSIVTVAR
jgi:hypothetical protein